MNKPRRKTWTAADIDELRRDYPNTRTSTMAERFGVSERAVYAQAKIHGIGKSAAYLASPAACRLRRGDDSGKSTRFRPGHKPWNFGMKGFGGNGRSKETQFKPGNRSGKAADNYQPLGAERVSKDGYLQRKAADNYQPLGAERVSKDGYLQRKVNDDLPLQRRWKAVHHILWEEHHGQVPKGHAVVFVDGDKENIRIDNLELVSRAELMSRNTIHNLPKPLAEVCQLKGALQRQINKRTKP